MLARFSSTPATPELPTSALHIINGSVSEQESALPSSTLAPYFFRQPWRDALWSSAGFRPESGTTGESEARDELSPFVISTFGRPDDLIKLLGPGYLWDTNAVVWAPATTTPPTGDVTSTIGFCGALTREHNRIRQEPIDKRLNDLGLALDDALWDLARQEFDAAYPIYVRGDFESAIAALRRGETDCPTDFFSQYYLGVLTLYGRTGEVDLVDAAAAEQHFRTAAAGAQRLLPKLPWAWTYAVLALYHTSVACYAQAADTRGSTGDPQRERLQLAAALELVEQALQMDPTFAEAHYHAAKCASLLQRGSVAPHLRAAATDDPIWLLRADCDADFDAARSESETVTRQMREELHRYVQWAADSLESWMTEETDLAGSPSGTSPTADRPEAETPSDLLLLHQVLLRALAERTYLGLRQTAAQFNEALAPRFFTPSYATEDSDPKADLAAHVYAQSCATSLLDGTEQIGRLIDLGTSVAQARKSAFVGVEHVLLALLGEVPPTGPGPAWDRQLLAVPAADALARLTASLDAEADLPPGTEPYAPPSTLRILEDACLEAGGHPVGAQHLLAAINRGPASHRWIIAATGIHPDRIALLARPLEAPPDVPSRLVWRRLHELDLRHTLGSRSWSRPLTEIVAVPVRLWTTELTVHLRVRLQTVLAPFGEFAAATLAAAPEDLERVKVLLQEVQDALDRLQPRTTVRAYLQTWVLLDWCRARAAHTEDEHLTQLDSARRAWRVQHVPAASGNTHRGAAQRLSSLATYALFGLPLSAGLAVIISTLLADVGVLPNGRWQETVPLTAVLIFLVGAAITWAARQRKQTDRTAQLETSSQTGEEIEAQILAAQSARTAQIERGRELAAMLRA